MSNIVAVPATPATISANLKKNLLASKLESIVNGITPYEGSARVTPSMIKIGKASALTALGSAVTAESFTEGLTFLACSFAYGQTKLDEVARLPAASRFALELASSLLKKGQSVTTVELRRVVLHTLSECVTLASTVRKAKSLPNNKGSETTVANGPATLTPTIKTVSVIVPWDGQPWHEYDGAVNRDADSGPKEALQNRLLDAAQADAKAAAERAAAEAIYPVAPSIAKVATIEHKVTEFTKMAEDLGIKLTLAQTKVLQKLYAKKVA